MVYKKEILTLIYIHRSKDTFKIKFKEIYIKT